MQVIAWFVRDIWHKYHSWYFKISPNLCKNNFEISLVVFMPNITTNQAITYTNFEEFQRNNTSAQKLPSPVDLIFLTLLEDFNKIVSEVQAKYML